MNIRLSNTRKALIALLSAVCIVFLALGLISLGNGGNKSITASAEDSTTITTVSSANDLSSLSDGGYYQLSADVTVTSSVTISSGYTVTLDLNGNTLSASTVNTVTVSSGGSLTVVDSASGGTISNTDTTSTYYVINNAGSLTIDSGIISGSYRSINTTGTLEINGGTISGSNYAVLGDTGATLTTINGGTISGDRGVYQNCGSLVVTGGTITGTCSSESGSRSAMGIFVASKSCTATISGGTITGVSYNSSYVSYGVYTYGDVSISGNAVIVADAQNTAKGSYAAYVYYTYDSNNTSATTAGSVSVSGNAKITASKIDDNNAVSSGIAYFGNTYATTYVTINGGTIYGETYGLSGNGSASYSDVVINGGEIEGGIVGYYHPESGPLTITGGSITGNYAGLQICAGTITITGGEFIATMNSTEISSSSNNASNKSGDGVIADGAALSIINRSGYSSVPSVTVTGGTFSSDSTVDCVQAYNYNSSAETRVTALETDGGSEQTIVEITGGTYSSDLSKGTYSSYCVTTGLTATETGESSGTYTISLSNADDYSSYAVLLITSSGVVGCNSISSALQNEAIYTDGSYTVSTVTIWLNGNVTEDVSIPANLNVTLDLRGYKITNSTTHTITVNSGATLTINDSGHTDGDTTVYGTVDNVTHGRAAIYSETTTATVVLNGGSYTRSAEASTSGSDSGDNSYYVLLNHGTMVINSGATIGSYNSEGTDALGKYSALIDNGWFNGSQNTDGTNAYLIINGGTFIGGKYNVKNDDYGVLTINNGTFTGGYASSVLSYNVTTINDGTFSADQYVIWTIYADDTMDQGSVTINGGTFTTASGYALVAQSGSEVEITSGTYSGKVYSSSSSTISITGGTYDSTAASSIATLIESGVVNANIDLVENEDGTYTANTYDVMVVSSEGTTTYYTDGTTTALEQAIAAIGDDTTYEYTITLGSDYELTTALTVASSQTITLDLNGYTLTFADDAYSKIDSLSKSSTTSYNYYAGIVNNGTLTITDTVGTGTVTITASSTYVSKVYSYYSIVYNGGTFTLDGGSLVSTGAGNYTGYGIYNAETLNVNGGYIEVNEKIGYGIYSTGTLTVTGGEIKVIGTNTNSSAIYLTGSSAVEISITGVTITAYSRGIYIASANVTLTIKDSEITATAYGVYNTSGTVTIQNTTVTVYSTATNYGLYNTSGTMTVESGTVVSNSGTSTAYGIYNTSGGTLTVTGGTISSYKYAVYSTSSAKNGNSTVNINGGTFSGSTYEIYCYQYSDIIITGVDNTTPSEVVLFLALSSIDTSINESNSTATVSDSVGITISGATDEVSSTGLAIISETSTEVEGATVYYLGVTADSAYAYIEAEDGTKTYYATPFVALSSATDGETVVLCKDCTKNISVTITNKSVTLDLNGYSITCVTTTPIIVGTGGTVNIINSNETPSAIYCKYSSSTSYRSLEITNGGTANIYENVILTSTSSTTVFLGLNATLNVYSGATIINTYSGGGDAISGNGNGSYNGTAINIYDGATVTSEYATGIYHPQVGTLTIYGGTITGHANGIQMCAGTLYIYDGTISATITSDALTSASNYITSKTGDGAIADGAAVSIVSRKGYGTYDSETSTASVASVNISGGTFTSATGNSAVTAYTFVSKDSVTTFTDSQSIVTITGGTFSSDFSGTYTTSYLLADGLTTAQNADGTYGITLASDDETVYVAAVYLNGNEEYSAKYTSLKLAFSDLTDGYVGTNGETGAVALSEATSIEIRLYANITDCASITNSCSYAVTLNLNGYSITFASGSTLTNSGTLTITGNGSSTLTFASESADQYGLVNEGTLTLSSGVTITDDVSSGSFTCVIQNNSGATLNISGATITAANNRVINNIGTMNITSGSVTGKTQFAILNAVGGELNISGGTFTSVTYTIWNNGTATLSGGTYSAGSNGYVINSLTGKLTVTDEITVTTGYYSVYVNGGTVEIQAGIYATKINCSGGTLSITGGYFTDTGAGLYVATGYAINSESTTISDVAYYQVLAESSFMATVNGVGYATLQDAIDAVTTDGDTVKLVAFGEDEYTIETAITVSSDDNLILDLNGKTVTITGVTSSYNSAVVNLGTLTITNGTLKAYASYTYGGIRNFGTITIESDAYVVGYFAAIYNVGGTANIYGSVTSDQYTNASYYSYSRAVYNSGSAAIVNIYDGAYLYGYYGVYNYVGTVNMYGGTVSAYRYGMYNTGYSTGNDEDGYTYTGGTINVTGGTITATGYEDSSGNKYTYGIYNLLGSLNVSDCTISGEYMGIYFGSYCTDLTLNISGNAVISGAWGVYTETGTLTIKDNVQITSNTYIAVRAGGKVNIYGGTISGTTIGVYSATAATITDATITAGEVGVYVAGGTATINGDTTITVEGDGTYTWVYGVEAATASTTNISGNAKIYVTNTSGGSAGVVYFGNGDEDTPTTVNISGGTIYGGTYGMSGNGSTSNYSAVTISGGSIEGGEVGYYHPESGTLTMTDGSITGKYSGLQICAGTITIEGGSISATATADEVSASGFDAENKSGDGVIADGAAISIIDRGYSSTPTITIKGGTFSSDSTVDTIHAFSYNSTDKETTWEEATKYVAVSCGSYTDTSAAAYVTSDFMLNGTVNEDGYYTLIDNTEDNSAVVATIVTENGTVGFTSLQNAIDAAGENATITLASSITESGVTISADDSIILDLNGKELKTSITNNGTLYITNGTLSGSIINYGTLYITDSVDITAASSSNNASLAKVKLAENEVTISSESTGVTNYGGDVTVESGASISGSTYGILSYGGSVTISGGFINGSVAFYNTTVSITGGYFTDTSVATYLVGTDYLLSSTVDSEYTSYYQVTTASNYVASINGVGYTTLAAAIAAVPTDGTETTITIAQSFTISTAVTIASTQNIVLDIGDYTITYSGSSGYAIINNGTLTINDGTISGRGIVHNYGTLYVNGGTFTSTVIVIGAEQNSVTYIYGGTLTSSNAGNKVIQVVENSKLYIYGGTITASTGTAIVINETSYTASDALVYIYGGTLTGDITNNARYSANNGGNLTIWGGELNGAVTTSGTIFVTDGTINGNITVTGGTAIISGGTVNGSVTVSGGTLTVTGGSFKDTTVADYVASGYLISGEVDSSSMYVVAAESSFAAKIGGVGYTTLSAAVAAAEDGDTVTLIATLTSSVAITSGNFTLEISGGIEIDTSASALVIGSSSITGVTLTITGDGTISSTYNGIYVYSGNTLIVNGCEISGTSSYGIFNAGTLTVNDGTINGVYGIGNTGKLTVNGGTITGTTYGIKNDSSKTLTISGSEISGTTYGINIEGSNCDLLILDGTITGKTGIYKNSSNGTITIYGGTITGTGNGTTNAAINLSGANSVTLNINGGTLTGNSGIYNGTNTTISSYVRSVNITGGTITGTSRGIYSNFNLTVSGGTISGAVAIDQDIGSLSITGGTISGSTTSLIVDDETTSASVTGGYFTGSIRSSLDTGFISGGSFSISAAESATNYLVDGYLLDSTVTASSYYTVHLASSYEASVNGVGYSTLKEAISAATDGDTVIVEREIYLSTKLTIGTSITLDLNGQIIMDEWYGISIIEVSSSITLTITDSVGGGMIFCTSDSYYNYSSYYIADCKVLIIYGNVIINDGIIIGDISVESGASLTINGGIFNDTSITSYISTDYILNGEETVLNEDDYEDYWLTVEDYNDNCWTLNALYEVLPTSSFVVTTTDSSNVTRGYTTLQNAINAVGNATATIELLADVTENVSITSGTIILDLNGYTLTNDGTSTTLTISGSSTTVTIKDDSENGGAVVNTIASTSEKLQAIYVSGGATLNVNNVTIEGAYNGIRNGKDGESGGTVNLNSGAVVIGTANAGIQTYSTVNVYEGASVEGKWGITFFGTEESAPTVVTISGGTVTGTGDAAISSNGTTGYGYVTLNISGGTISSESTAIYLPAQNGTATITGGTITGSTGIEIRNGSLTISDDAIITATDSFSVIGASNMSNVTGAAVAITPYNETDVTVTISGGTLTGEYAVYECYTIGTYDKDGNELAKTTSPSVTVTPSLSGGTYTGAISAQNATGFITDGSYSSTTAAAYVAEGSALSGETKEIDGVLYYGIVATTSDDPDVDTVVATITTDGVTLSYTSLEKAIAAAADGDEIVLVADVTESVTITSGKNVTLNLSSYGITVESGAAITVEGGATLTVTGNGTITGVTRGISSYGDLTINGGTISGGYGVVSISGSLNITAGTINGTSTYGVYTADNATISGGTISGTWAVVQMGGSLEITGGTITATNSNSSAIGVYAYYGLTTNISGGTITATSSGDNYSYGVYTFGTVNISGDVEITATANTSKYAAYGVDVNTYTGNTSSSCVNVSGSAVITAINTSGNSAGIVYFANGDEDTPTKVTISGGTISGGTYGLSGNGAESNYSEVVISGGTISGNWAYYHPEDGTLTISGGEFIGVYSALQICSGTVTITSGTFETTATTDSLEASDDYYGTKTGSGPLADGAAISVVDRSGYTDTPYVAISGGTFISESGNAVLAYSNKDGNSFTDTWEDAGDSIEISGGYYSSIPANSEYYADHLVPTAITISGTNYYTVVTGEFVTAPAADETEFYYNGEEQTYSLTENTYAYTISGNVQTEAGTYTVTVTLNDGYMWDDTFSTKAREYTFTINSAVALVNGVGYASVEAAVAAAETAGTATVQLLANVTVDTSLTIASGMDITIDLNGYTLTISGTTSYYNSTLAKSYTTNLLNNGKLTITDSATGGILSTSAAYGIYNNGTLTIEGGTISATDCAIRQGSGSTVITGGTVTASGSYTLMIDAGTLTIGTENGNDDDLLISGTYVMQIANGADLTMYSGTVSGYYGMLLYGNDSGNRTEVTINGGLIEGTNCGIYAYGGASNSYITVTINNGTIIGETEGIYFPAQNGELYIYGGTITGATGVEVRGGTVVIEEKNGNEIVINSTADDTTQSGTPSGGGSTVTGAAVAISSYNNEDISVTINSGTFNGVTAVYEGYIESSELTATIDINLTGGTYNGAICSDSTTETLAILEITGGVYSDTSAAAYVVEGSALAESTTTAGYYGIVSATSVVAEVNSVSYSNLQDAIDAAEDGDTIVLVNNVTESITIDNKDITLDLAGYTLTDNGSHTITVNSNATLTIIDSSDDGSGKVDSTTHQKAAIANFGTVYIYGGTYTRSAEAGYRTESTVGNGNNSWYTIYNQGTMVIGSETDDTLNNVTVTTHMDSSTGVGAYSSLIINGDYTDSTASLTINGGEFIGGLNTVKNGEYGDLTINGGSFSNTYQNVIMNWNIAEINGGTFTVSGVSNSVVWVGYDSSIAVGNLTIKDGTFVNEDGGYVVNVSSSRGAESVVIKGGTFTGVINLNSATTAEIYGGIYSDTSAAAYVVEGSALTANDDGTYGVEEIATSSIAATIGNIGYATLQDAINAAASGDTVVITAETITLTETLTISGKDITVDLNGNTVTASDSATITVESGASLTITDSGSTGTIANTGSYYAIVTNGTLTVQGGTITNTNYRAINGTSGSVINVEGGTVSGDYGVRSDGGTINIYENATINGVTAGVVGFGATVYMEGGTVTASIYGVYLEMGITDTKAASKATITGGTITASGNTSSWVMGIVAGAQSDVTISGTVEITATNSNAEGGSVGIYYYANNDESTPTKVTISGGTISGGTYGLSGNGAESNYSEVVISGGTISGNWAYYHPEDGTLTISGGTFNGVYAALQICAGEVTIISGTFTATADADSLEASDDYYGTKTSSGPLADGAAVSIVDRDYSTTPTLEISGGTFTSADGIEALQAYSFSNKTGYQGDWDEAGESIEISGGYYSTVPSDSSYYATGLMPTQLVNGYYTVIEGEFVDVPDNNTITYDGNGHYLAASGDGYAVVSVKDSSSAEVANGVATDVGEYTVTVTLLSGYMWSDLTTTEKTYTVTIANASVDKPEENTATFTYDGSEQTYLESTAYYTVTDGKQTNAGTYTVTVALNAGFTWSDGSTDTLTFSWTIGQADNSISVSITGWTYGE
ncbi:MAG: hypothetical protein LUD19_05355, partial [Clostridia bacterium]|nr:hypothetical protein [Clostridia bacterium]